MSTTAASPNVVGTGTNFQAGDVGSIEPDSAAPRRAKPHDAMHGGRLSHAVAAEEADDFAPGERTWLSRRVRGHIGPGRRGE